MLQLLLFLLLFYYSSYIYASYATIFSVQEVPIVLHIWLTSLGEAAQNSNRLVHLKFLLLLIKKRLEHGWKRKFTLSDFIEAPSYSFSFCALQEMGNGKCWKT